MKWISSIGWWGCYVAIYCIIILLILSRLVQLEVTDNHCYDILWLRVHVYSYFSLSDGPNRIGVFYYSTVVITIFVSWFHHISFDMKLNHEWANYTFKVLSERSFIFEPGSVVAAEGLSEELLAKAIQYCNVQYLHCCKCKTSMIYI